MKVLCLQKYGPQMATYRYRFAQYTSYFEKHGIKYQVQSLIDDGELRAKLRSGRYNVLPLFVSYLRRIFCLLSVAKFDLVIVYVEALPQLPFWFEWFLFLSRTPYVYDLDDPVYLNYQRSGNPIKNLLRNKIGCVMARAHWNFMGSPALTEEAKTHSSHVEFIPTVVSLKNYPHLKEYETKPGPLTIGWMGSPSTSLELLPLMKIFEPFTNTGQVRLVFVGAAPMQSVLGCELREWKLERQQADLLEFDVGIMPLDNTPWNRGKCGFKLLQYMGMGIPVIASAVGANNNIVTHGEDGFLVSSESEWSAAITKYLQDREKLKRMGAAARKKIEQKFCLEVYGDRYCELLKEAVTRG